MASNAFIPLRAATLVVLVACGARTDAPVDAHTDGGGQVGSGSGSAGGSSGGGAGSGGTGACVDVAASSFDTSCRIDGDCVNVTTGRICPGDCLCGSSPINQAALAQWSREAMGLGVACPCVNIPPPRCIGGVCQECTPANGGGVVCPDGG